MRAELDIPISLDELCDILSANPSGSEYEYIRAICTDTREAAKGDLFIALCGNGGSGESYVNDALRIGCTVISSTEANGIIHVTDTSEALLKIAELYISKLKPKHTVAVTGSVGKSTTVKFLKRILSEKFNVHSPNGNFNNHIGVPFTVFSAPCDAEVLVLELGMNHAGEISRLSRCVHPNLGIITGIGTAHVGNLGSRQGIARAKLEILDGMDSGMLILPRGEPLLQGVEGAIYVSDDPSLSEYSFCEITDGLYELISPLGKISGIEFFDRRAHLIHDLALAAVCAQIVGLTNDGIINGIRAISECDLRQRFIELKDYTVFDDSYNASLESIIADIRYITSMKRPTGALLGDVLELGDLSEAIHERIGYESARLGIKHLYLFGEYATYTARGALSAGMARECIFINTDLLSPEISTSQIKDNHDSGEIILFKASHKLRLDKIADLIKKEEGINND